ncbi:uncharacterized protein NPIL_82431 [Nephila pilipes]|uniref:Uncharacterized protein n=1 Tax=Nephila pilipes TaxID=299642 RepID=A0A8X6QW18_NEPPI|nr:uncharacterized protein NPIL_82431 [Nephila pilipes]
MTLNANKKRAAKHAAYGYNVEDRLAQIVLIFTKKFLSSFIFPTFTNLMALIFCSLCHDCCTQLKNLTQEILSISPEVFETSLQINILRRKTRIHDLLNNIQDFFWLPSFLIFVANFSASTSVIGMVLYRDLNAIVQMGNVFTSLLFFGIHSFGSILFMLWVTGGIPISLQEFNEAFCKKAHLRLIRSRNFSEPQLKRELSEKPDFYLTGCDMISFKRSTIFAVFGALLTYTVLLINMKKSVPISSLHILNLMDSRMTFDDILTSEAIISFKIHSENWKGWEKGELLYVQQNKASKSSRCPEWMLKESNFA